LQNSKIFISGSNGWIGQSFQKALQQRNVATEGIDRNNLPNFATRLSASKETSGNKIVIHCAGLAHQPKNTHYSKMLDANAQLPAHLAAIAKDAAADTFVLISSAKVMGDFSSAGFVETDSCKPIGAYAQSKLAGEVKVRSVLKDSKTRLIIVRPPLVYGPEVRANFLSLMRLAYSGLPLPLLNATQPRSMIYIGNLISTVLDLINHSNASGCYLLSDQESLSTAEWIERLRTEFALPTRLFSVPTSLMRVGSRLAGQSSKFERMFDPFLLNTKKLTTLGIEPKIDISQSIGLTARWFKLQQNHLLGQKK
jgi:nucleoside-diphosphate-sugar epimerase